MQILINSIIKNEWLIKLPIISRSKLEETKELQKLRERPHGISAVALALGKRVTVEEEVTEVRQYNL